MFLHSILLRDTGSHSPYSPHRSARKVPLYVHISPIRLESHLCDFTKAYRSGHISTTIRGTLAFCEPSGQAVAVGDGGTTAPWQTIRCLTRRRCDRFCRGVLNTANAYRSANDDSLIWAVVVPLPTEMHHRASPPPPQQLHQKRTEAHHRPPTHRRLRHRPPSE